ncbi:MAG: hypothetical protein IID40_09265, partial [Planctomycetes bacterium]|nr:hypothetical protein [Planctomycetota bacterium]
MRCYSFTVFDRQPGQPALRFLGPDGALIAERDLPPAAIDELVARVEKGYAKTSPDLADIGRRLYDWLDGPTER